MLIIGCDYHPSVQQINWVDTETGECGEKRLMHSDGEAERFYRELKQKGVQVRVGIETTGQFRWFESLLDELGFELWVGGPAQIRARRVRKQRNDRLDAEHIRKLVMEDRFPRSLHCCLDIGLPQLNGIEAAKQISKVAPHSKILFVSQATDPGVVEIALGLGAGYVSKSCIQRDLLPAVESVQRSIGNGQDDSTDMGNAQAINWRMRRRYGPRAQISMWLTSMQRRGQS